MLKTDPDCSALPATVPPDLRRLLRWCLEKDPKRRLQSIGDARVQVEDLLRGASEEPVETVRSRPVQLRQAVLPWVMAALAFGLAVVLTQAAPWRNVRPSVPLRLTAELAPEVFLAGSALGSATILSPDGAVVSFVAQKGEGRPQLYVRQLDRLQATPLAGTDDAESPFFSPDGQWIAFFAGGKLKKISVTGGEAVTLCDAPSGRGGGWAEDGTIVFSPHNGWPVNLLQVSTAGGQPDSLVSLAEKPQLWSNGRYLDRPGNRGFELHPDGERFAVAFPPIVQTAVGTKQDKVVFVFNFFDELRRIAPATEE